MSASEIPTPQTLPQLLDACRRQVRRRDTLVGLSIVVSVGLACLLTAALLDLCLGLPSTVRLVILGIFVTSTAWLIRNFLVRPLQRSISDELLGAAVDLSSPELQESLATLISIERPTAGPTETGADVFRRRIRRQVGEQLTALSPEQIVDHQQVRRWLAAAGTLVAVAVLPSLVWPSNAALLVQRIVTPFANLGTAGNLYFEVPDGNRVVARGSRVRLAAIPRWRSSDAGQRPQTAFVEMSANGRSERQPLLYDEVTEQFAVELPQVPESIVYRITGGGATTEWFQLTAADVPEIVQAQMIAAAPEYTGLPERHFDGMLGHLDVFEHSQLEIHLDFSLPVRDAELIWLSRDSRPVTEAEKLEMEFDDLSGEEVFDIDPDAPLVTPAAPLAVRVSGEVADDGLSATFRMEADAGGDFEFRVEGRDGLSNPQEPDRHLTVTFDTPPSLHVGGIRDRDSLRPDDILPVNCVAADDVGLKSVELHYRVNTDSGQILPAGQSAVGRQILEEHFRIPLEALSLKTGDMIRLQVRAVDDRPEPGPQETWSSEVTIRIDHEAGPVGRQALQQESAEILNGLEQLAELLKQDLQTVELQIRQASQDWSVDAQKLPLRLSEKEQQQGQILESIAAVVAGHPLMAGSSHRLSGLAHQLKSDLPETLRLAATSDADVAGDELKQAGRQLDQIRNRLLEEIEIIRGVAQIELDLAELNRLALEAEQVAADAVELDQQRQAGKPENISDADWQKQLNQKQQDLRQDHRELVGELSELLKNQQELLLAAQRSQQEQLRRLAQHAEQLAIRQTQITDQLQRDASDVPIVEQSLRDQQPQAVEVRELSQQFQQLTGRLSLEILRLPAEAERSQQAASLVLQAQAVSEQTVRLLQNSSGSDAVSSGRRSAELLTQAAATAGSESAQNQQSLIVPEEVGEHVTEALQNLQEAEESMQQMTQESSDAADQQTESGASNTGQQATDQQSSGDPQAAQDSQAQSGDSGETDGQSGQPANDGGPTQSKPSQSGQPLSSAAAALAAAAREALPMAMNASSSSPGAGADGQGGTSAWNGLLPGRGVAPAGTRNWGHQVDELNSETTETQATARDAEYESLIRMYFREVAKARRK
ncbi:MAG: hypothetical protein R3C49_11560 [Planctomycetaceae bacterium]